MDVQVIGQQWEFTYRYPTLGGLETPHLFLPADTLIRLHVTSLDAVHSFWAYQLGVKADANPGVDNVVYVQPKGPRTFDIRCAELCGLWHGYMFDTGQVVEQTAFTTWIKQQQSLLRAGRQYLPPYATPTCPSRPGGPDDHREEEPMSTTTSRRPPVWRRLIGFNLLTAICSASSATTSAGSSGTTSPARASTTSATPTRTTSPSSSATCSVSSAS